MSYEVLESRKTYEGKIVTITVDKRGCRMAVRPIAKL